MNPFLFSLFNAIILIPYTLKKREIQTKFLIYYVSILCFVQLFVTYYSFMYILNPYIYLYFQTAWFIHHFFVLNHPKLRSRIYRIFISYPSAFWMSATWFSIPFMILHPFYNPFFTVLIFIMASWGLYQSMYHHKFGEIVDIPFDKQKYNDLVRISQNNENSKENLKIFQLTDTHLGSFMTINRLSRICKKIVELNPDLVLLTGDFYTREGHNDDDALSHALSPLKQLKGKVFACLGNHDYENLNSVKKGLIENDICLLVDEETFTETRIGKIQILGSKFKFGGETDVHIRDLFAKYPKQNDVKLHITLLHNPSVFQYIPDVSTMVFSGHFHGGQIGLLNLGLNITILSLINLFKGKIIFPDQGIFAHLKNRLYAHRGTGHYGFPIRFGVPSEETLLQVHLIE